MLDTHSTRQCPHGMAFDDFCEDCDNAERIEVGAIALWGLQKKTMLEAAGYSTDWDSQPRTVKNTYYRQVRAVLKVVK